MNKEILLRTLVQKLKTKDKEWWFQLPQNDHLLFNLLMQCVKESYKPNSPLIKKDLDEITYYELKACCNEANPDLDFDNNTTKDILPRTLRRIRALFIDDMKRLRR